jgi:hypothetical protein
MALVHVNVAGKIGYVASLGLVSAADICSKEHEVL